MNFALKMRNIYIQKFPDGYLPEIPEYCGIINKALLKKRSLYRNTKIYVKVKMPISYFEWFKEL